MLTTLTASLSLVSSRETVCSGAIAGDLFTGLRLVAVFPPSVSTGMPANDHWAPPCQLDRHGRHGPPEKIEL